MDEDEQALLAGQQEFLASARTPAATLASSLSPRSTQSAETNPAHPERFSLDFREAKDPEIMSQRPSGSVIGNIVERTRDQGYNHNALEADVIRTEPIARPKRINWQTKGKPSRFSAGRKASDTANIPTNDTLQQQIEAENTRKLAMMTVDEIEKEREELMASLDPAVLAMLQKRGQKHSVTTAVPVEPDFGPKFIAEEITAVPVVRKQSSREKSHEADVMQPSISKQDCALPEEQVSPHDSAQHRDSKARCTSPDDSEHHVHSASCLLDSAEPTTVHFPQHEISAELDPNSETFLNDLKEKYFPNLQHNPSTLAWMQPPTDAEDLADYHASQASLMPAQLRFDFQGNFVAPRTSREIEHDIGLHHHADAPLAAGYTIPELAHLSRSAFASQACLAIQTTGRIMYKIGKLFYGPSISGKLKALIEKTMVEQTLLERARDRHLGVSSYATEALWQANLGREGTIIEGQ